MIYAANILARLRLEITTAANIRALAPAHTGRGSSTPGPRPTTTYLCDKSEVELDTGFCRKIAFISAQNQGADMIIDQSIQRKQIHQVQSRIKFGNNPAYPPPPPKKQVSSAMSPTRPLQPLSLQARTATTMSPIAV